MENTNENFYYIKEKRKTPNINLQDQVLSCTPEQDVQIVTPDCCADAGEVVVPPHNLLNGLQGGTIYERYHLNKVQYDSIANSEAALIFNNGLSKTNGVVTLGSDQSDSTGNKGKLLTDLLLNRQDNNSVDNGSNIRVASRSILQSVNNASFESDSELSFSNAGSVGQITSFSTTNGRMSSILTSQSLTQSASALINRRSNTISQGIQLTDDIGNVSNARMLVTDSINFRGLEYAAIYYTNFTDRSLIDKGYLYSRILPQPTSDADTFLVSAGGVYNALQVKANLIGDNYYTGSQIVEGNIDGGVIYGNVVKAYNYFEFDSSNHSGFAGQISAASVLTAPRNWTMPDKNGIVALLSDIPNIDLSLYARLAANNTFTGTTNTFSTGLTGSSTTAVSPGFVRTANADFSSSVAMSTSGIEFVRATFRHNIAPLTLTANRSVTLPDKSGVVALISDLANFAVISGGNSFFNGDQNISGSLNVNNHFTMDAYLYISGTNNITTGAKGTSITVSTANPSVNNNSRYTLALTMDSYQTKSIFVEWPSDTGKLALTSDLLPYAKLAGGNTFSGADNIFNTPVRINNQMFGLGITSNIAASKIGVNLTSQNYNLPGGGTFPRGSVNIFKYNDNSTTGWFSGIVPNDALNQNGYFQLPNANSGTLARLEDLPKMKYGNYVGSGNGTTTAFTFPHGFLAGSSPSSAVASFGANTPTANMLGFSVTYDTNNIIITFATAPAGQFSLNWIAIQA